MPDWQVRTSSKSKIGAHATVHARVHIHGSNTQSGPVFLAQSNCSSPFLPGQADIFTVWLADLGHITRLDIGQSGEAVAGWLVLQITIRKAGADEYRHNSCDNHDDPCDNYDNLYDNYDNPCNDHDNLYNDYDNFAIITIGLAVIMIIVCSCLPDSNLQHKPTSHGLATLANIKPSDVTKVSEPGSEDIGLSWQVLAV